MNIRVFYFENMGRDKMKFSLPFLFFQLLFFSCNKFSAALLEEGSDELKIISILNLLIKFLC